MTKDLPNRRGFLESAAALAAAAALPAWAAAELPTRLRLSCSSLAFSDKTWYGALEAIKALGFRYAELAMFEGWCHVSPSKLTEPAAHGREIGEVCARLGVEPVALHANFALGKNHPGLTSPQPRDREATLKQFDRVLTCVRSAGIPLLNVQPGKFIRDVPRKKCLDAAAAVLRDMHERAVKAKVVLTFENHTGSIGEKPDDCLALLEAVPGLRLDYDFAHVIASGTDPEKTRPLLKYVAHTAVRNARRGSFNEPVGDGGKLGFDLGWFLRALRDAKTDAFLAVEYYEPKMQPQIVALKAVLERHGIPTQVTRLGA
jgi:sugar phosphate isomerase/epimerase